MFLFAESAPLFLIPRAAILCGGALSGPFQPNARRRKDMTITADLSRRGLAARRRLAPTPSAGLRISIRRDALSFSPLRMPERGPDMTSRAPATRCAGRSPTGLASGPIARRAFATLPGLSAGLAHWRANARVRARAHASACA